jgi:2-oxoglutarate dehydrogenase E1 component
VVLLLPHGFEGQGPDHSSARIERFLGLCAQGNMTVALPTTPANYFHLLRWQALSPRRAPLVVFTPKSMLRLKEAVSAVADFATGSFLPVIGDPQEPDPASVRRVLLCSGKIYYDLAQRRAAEKRTDTAIIRVERLYPVPAEELTAELGRYPGVEEITWVQEEPANMGAWPTMALNLPAIAGRGIGVISLPASGPPAVGSATAHKAEHQHLVDEALPGA